MSDPASATEAPGERAAIHPTTTLRDSEPGPWIEVGAPTSIVESTPARPLRSRFPSQIADALLEIAWWDRAPLREALRDFRELPVDAFARKHRR